MHRNGKNTELETVKEFQMGNRQQGQLKEEYWVDSGDWSGTQSDLRGHSSKSEIFVQKALKST